MFADGMRCVTDERAIGERLGLTATESYERQRRLWAANEARSAGFVGITATALATGICTDDP